jgi:hypothetical protein
MSRWDSNERIQRGPICYAKRLCTYQHEYIGDVAEVSRLSRDPVRPFVVRTLAGTLRLVDAGTMSPGRIIVHAVGSPIRPKDAGALSALAKAREASLLKDRRRERNWDPTFSA